MRRFGFYQYACLLWCVNVVLVILSYFVAASTYCAIVFVPLVFIAFGAMIMCANKEKIRLTQVMMSSAVWSKTIAFASILYTFVNFFICTILLIEGGPHIDNGVYCLSNHGSIVREITKTEYEALLKVEGRMFIGHFLTFTALPVVFFSARKKINKF